LSQEGSIITSGTFKLSGFIGITGTVVGQEGNYSGNGSISGDGKIFGQGVIFGFGMVSGKAPEEDRAIDDIQIDDGGYLKNGLFVLFTMLLAAIICSDIIADDLANSSFVLYFSRPTRAIDYLIGKFIGLLWVMSIFCLILPVLYVLVMLGTQTGDNYSGGLKILGKTILMGIYTSIFFLPYGLMVSSFTNRKAYAGVSIFVSFFVLTIISEIFSEFNNTWALISPINMLLYSYDLLFGRSLEFGLENYQLVTAMLSITIIPMIIVFIRLQRKGAGK
jgi:ABC-type transport system involved in multi-copper enzyme maturation permease subunit